MPNFYPQLSAIKNYFEVNTRLITSGMPTAEQITLIRDAGFDTVINLAMPDQAGALPDEDLIVEEAGMKYVSLPVRWQEPKQSDLEQFFTIVDRERAEGRLFIHCSANYRVSAFMYLYRVLREGWDEPAARADMLTVWTPNEWWQAFIDAQLTEWRNQKQTTP
jgi:protein tyrosine phosphatase (PTP) superfamily phosphohydrolase (DUF442 family)